MTDTIADFLTRIRNAIKANHKFVEIPHSNMKVGMSQVLLEKGYIRAYKVEEVGIFKVIKIALKYDHITRRPAIQALTRISKPGLRKYSGSQEIPRVLNGLGIAILSTSKGIMSDKEAKMQNIGGEVLCFIY